MDDRAVISMCVGCRILWGQTRGSAVLKVTMLVERKSDHYVLVVLQPTRIHMVAGLVGLGISRLWGAVLLTHAEQSKLDGNNG